MKIHLDLKENSYDIVVSRGILKTAGEELNLNRKVLVVTDSGVPEEYAKTIAGQCKEAYIETVPQGEMSKSIATFQKLLSRMLSLGFTRSDCVVAVGGGVVGDLAGFVAASFMRGVDFYNIPTTLLSQIDSSIGGKVAVNLDGIKNIVGAFYQPKKVIIDPDVLKSLPPRQISNGLAEAVKMALTFDEELFEIFENENPMEKIDDIIVESLNIKKNVVEKDEKEAGLRKILNFGHSIGHGIESVKSQDLYHGECVALGMIPMCSESVRERLLKVLDKLSLPTSVDCDTVKIMDAMSHDKKIKNGKLTAVFVEEAGSFVMKDIECGDLKDKILLTGAKEI